MRGFVKSPAFFIHPSKKARILSRKEEQTRLFTYICKTKKTERTDKIAMNKIISKEIFSENVVQFEVEAPLIVKAHRAGHFVIVRVGEQGERMPLTIASSDIQRGS